jgi:NAD(P)-dependent dehydrogenase (short-subunit alcohol dehydrogenase family)
MTVDMAYSHGRQGIRVNAIAPGHITTPMVTSVSAPGPRAEFMNEMRSQAGLLGTPGDGWDVAWAAAFLASESQCHLRVMADVAQLNLRGLCDVSFMPLTFQSMPTTLS